MASAVIDSREPVANEVVPFALENLSREELEAMREAGADVLECRRVLRKGGLNLVGEVLKGQGQFVKMNHYPKGDVFDRDSQAQYYYHAHRGGEHGHFHTFLRQPGMPSGIRPVPDADSRDWPKGDKALSHIVAISMDRYGEPLGLFTTNRWVTGESWYAADDIRAMLDRFVIDHAYPSWPTNRWITAMMRLFRPQIETLLGERDEKLRDWARRHPEVDVYEDRDLEVLSETPIDVAAQIKAIEKALG